MSSGLPAPQAGGAVLVTGASSGIGAALAYEFASRRYPLVLLARREDRLRELAGELTARYSVRAEVIACDLADAEARATVPERVSEVGLRVDVLCNCAGFGVAGPFADSDPAIALRMVRTNFEAVIDLTRAFVPGMRRRGRGAVLIVSSIAGMVPMPSFAAYAATKAATLAFAEALHVEVKNDGVSVTAMCPGQVNTEFTRIAGLESGAKLWPGFLTPDPAECACVGLAALAKRRRVVVPNRGVSMLAMLCRHTPRGISLHAFRPLLERAP